MIQCPIQTDQKCTNSKDGACAFKIIEMGEEGFEPPTPWFVATCSGPLSYTPLTHEFHNSTHFPNDAS